jgi:hypothetical protein
MSERKLASRDIHEFAIPSSSQGIVGEALEILRQFIQPESLPKLRNLGWPAKWTPGYVRLRLE